MRTYMIGAATCAVLAALGCSDGSQLGGAGGSSSSSAGTSPSNTAGTSPGAGTGATTGGSGSDPTSGSGTTGGSGGVSTTTGGSGGTSVIPTGGMPTGGASTGGSGGVPPAGGSGGGSSTGLESGPFKVLIISTTLEFHHDSIPDCQKMVSDFGTMDAANTWTTQIETDDLKDFTATGLQPFRLIFSCSPTGTVFSGNSKVADKAGAMKAFTDFITNGGAFAGVHSASDFEKTNGFPWFTNTLMGAFFDHHDNDGTAGTVTPDPNAGMHAVLKGLSPTLSTQDEWYYMNRDVSAQPGFKILQRLAKDNRPVSWVKEVGMGRMFYTIRGHNKTVYTEKEFRAIVQNAIMWVTKRAN